MAKSEPLQKSAPAEIEGRFVHLGVFIIRRIQVEGPSSNQSTTMSAQERPSLGFDDVCFDVCGWVGPGTPTFLLRRGFLGKPKKVLFIAHSAADG